MFGQQQQSDQDDTAIPEQSINGVLDDQATPVVTPTAAWQHPGVPLDGAAAEPTPTDVNDLGTTAAEVEAAASIPVTNDAPSDDLVDIKQQALSQLAPLVGHLDQPPEERFRTTMMLIQASDDHTLIKDAYAAAQAITDEKARAQALLDVVNEINYFTQAPAQ